jgi:hypothetical protein
MCWEGGVRAGKRLLAQTAIGTASVVSLLLTTCLLLREILPIVPGYGVMGVSSSLLT